MSDMVSNLISQLHQNIAVQHESTMCYKAIKSLYQACCCYLYKIEQFKNQKSIVNDYQTEPFDAGDKA